MEDTFRAELSVLGSSANAYFAVYDGHGGDNASRFLQEDLHKRIEEDPELLSDDPISAITDAFEASEKELLRQSTFSGWLDGSTAICCLILNNKIFTANVGDSRAVLCSLGKAHPLSVDHKPSNDKERDRILKAGGKIMHLGVWRVEGVLALSRAFGDRHLKKYVHAIPDIEERSISENDEFLILASDGIWDVLSNQDAVDIVLKTNYRNDARASAQTIVEVAYRRGSQDNMTCIVINLDRYRGFSDEHIRYANG